MTESEYSERLRAAEWLNTQGYDIELERDGFWMEELRFTEHKTKDVVDLMLMYSETLREQNARYLAAVREMEKMLPVLEQTFTSSDEIWDHDLAPLNAYRLALQAALANRSNP